MNAAIHPTAARRRRWLALTLLALTLACFATAGALRARERFLTRGIPPALPEPMAHGGPRAGVNVYLAEADEETLRQTLAAIAAARVTYVKQSFSYQTDFDWAAADRFMASAGDAGLIVVPLLDGDPADQFAPPADVAAYARWAGDFAARYSERLRYYIIWDEPNLSSHWGNAPVNPAGYAALLTAAAAAIRHADADAIIVAAPLAPTTEIGPDNLSETLYLRSLYEAGAAESFDVVALKPYGFDTGPDDRRVAAEFLNFSRPILVRGLMVSLGDGATAIWAGNWGWNSLPNGWAGSPSLWGQTSADKQAALIVAALERTRREWPWMGVMFLENWEANAPSDDPRWGFSIAGRPAADALSGYLAAQPPDIAWPGFHLAAPGPSQQYRGTWQFSPEFGADIGQTGDSVTFTFWGTDVGVRVRRADFRARIYATIDGQPANALPMDENGAALVLTSPDPAADFLSTEWIARDLIPSVHTVELTAARGWDQWALNGFTVAYHPPEATRPWLTWALVGLGLVSAALAVWVGRRAQWGATGATLAGGFRRLSERAQMALVAGVAAVAGLTGWLTWGPDALGLYRRLGDMGQLAATAGAATIFYVTPAAIVYGLALAVLFGLLVLRPAWGLALIALTMPFYVPPLPKSMLGYRFSPVEVFTLMTAAAWLARAALDAGVRYRRDGLHLARPRLLRADLAVMGFVVFATLATFFAVRRDVALSEWRVVIIEPALFYLLLRAIRPTRREMWVMLDAFVLGGVIVAGYGLWQVVTGQGLITAEGGLLRLRSIYGSPNNAALYLDRLLPLLAAMVLLGRRQTHGRRRVVYGLAIVPVGLALLLTFSKGALFLGVPAGLLVVFWVWQRRAGRRVWPWVAGAAVVGVAALLAATRVPALAARLDLFGVTGVFRVHLWRAALNMIADRPLLGVGPDNFLYAYRGRYILDAAWQEPNLSHPHNILLDFATRAGLLGLLAGAWLLGEAAITLRRAVVRADESWLPVAVGLAGALAAMVAHGLVDHSFFLVDLAFVFYLILGVAVWLRPDAPAISQGESALHDS